ncbi:sensor histidine kinase [Methylomonas montana]|uniref:sensor histidine kinase n=1 Tax=Methylomonas montana TaxID=3058963 RepID=UPI002657D3AA|nr:sensor histidine kinase [Methylomonas montana]WKJ91585.1 sensor histidine kinase [Methylomonas montana]
MNLKLHLLSRITAVALICLLATIAYVLHFSGQQSATLAQNTLMSLAKQLEFQLLSIGAGDRPTKPFPDFDLWKQTGSEPGICVRYQSIDGNTTRSLCKGIDLPSHQWPRAFEMLYRQLFKPDFSKERQVVYNHQVYGVLTVSVSTEMAMARAWENVRHLFGLSLITVTSVCLLVYLTVSRSLRPAQAIVAGLKRLSLGELSYRLPDFELIEWRQTAEAINRLANNQQQLLDERQKLAVMLMNLQEEERRHLARELHDELGQCLTAIRAVAASVTQTAERQCPQLIPEAEQIGRFTQVMQNSVRDLLTQLRPAELDELGLEASLRSLVARWNQLDHGITRYSLKIAGDSMPLPEATAISLFRIAQEAISNIAKHASANRADLSLTIDTDNILMTIEDDGVANSLNFANRSGIGLLGMRERVLALNGQFSLQIAEPHGLIIQIRLPLLSPQASR